jgi:hypothetical protein
MADVVFYFVLVPAILYVLLSFSCIIRAKVSRLSGYFYCKILALQNEKCVPLTVVSEV